MCTVSLTSASPSFLGVSPSDSLSLAERHSGCPKWHVQEWQEREGQQPQGKCHSSDELRAPAKRHFRRWTCSGGQERWEIWGAPEAPHSIAFPLHRPSNHRWPSLSEHQFKTPFAGFCRESHILLSGNADSSLRGHESAMASVTVVFLVSPRDWAYPTSEVRGPKANQGKHAGTSQPLSKLWASTACWVQKWNGNFPWPLGMPSNVPFFCPPLSTDSVSSLGPSSGSPSALHSPCAQAVSAAPWKRGKWSRTAWGLQSAPSLTQPSHASSLQEASSPGLHGGFLHRELAHLSTAAGTGDALLMLGSVGSHEASFPGPFIRLSSFVWGAGLRQAYEKTAERIECFKEEAREGRGAFPNKFPLGGGGEVAMHGGMTGHSRWVSLQFPWSIQCFYHVEGGVPWVVSPQPPRDSYPTGQWLCLRASGACYAEVSCVECCYCCWSSSPVRGEGIEGSFNLSRNVGYVEQSLRPVKFNSG